LCIKFGKLAKVKNIGNSLKFETIMVKKNGREGIALFGNNICRPEYISRFHKYNWLLQN